MSGTAQHSGQPRAAQHSTVFSQYTILFSQKQHSTVFSKNQKSTYSTVLSRDSILFSQVQYSTVFSQ
jgi:hypothetical protein